MFFYSPYDLQHNKEVGPDSLKYKAMNDSIKLKTDRWEMKNLVSEWIWEFSRLTAGKTGS